MPGLVAFGRRWSIGSDDLLIPSFTMFAVHVIWIIVMVVALILDFGEQTSWPKVACKVQSLGLICTIFLLVLFSAILEICLTVVSLRGSILNDTPRSGVPYLLYIRLFALILEIIWSIVALVWSQKFYFSCDLVLIKQTMIGLIMWVWFVLLSALITAWCVFDVAGRSWVKMKRYQANVKEMEHRHPSFRRSGSTARNWRQRKVMRQYESSWNNRCRILFCCVHNSEGSRDSFSDLAKLLSEFFRDLDVVPSDIIVGLLLLRKLQRLEQVSVINEKRNNTYEFLSGIAITPNTKFVAMNDSQDLESYHNVVYYMRYASAAYGWLWYVIPNGFRGLFNLCSNVKCCFHRYLCNSLGNELSQNVVEDNCCFCNVAVIPTMFDPASFEIVYATYHVEIGETPFFVVVDYDKKAIVVSIRGTLSLKDLMTDLNAEAEQLPLDPAKDGWLGHKGMVQVATYLKSKLLGEGILDKAVEMCQARSNETFNVVLVGHSLGGGAAAILAILLKDRYPDLLCYAYSPPGGLLSMPAVEYTKDFVTSVIVGKDLVPRIGLSQMEALRADLLNAIKKSHTPKWKTIMSGMKCCKCIRNQEFSSSDLSTSAQTGEASSSSFQEDLLSPNDSMASMGMHQPLYPPGRIMHVVRHHPKKDEIKYESVWRRIVGKGEPVFQAIWTDNTDYDEVLISPGMIQDHMPDTVLKALNRVTTSLGPAKPQRTLTNNASPMNLLPSSSRDNVLDIAETSSKIHSEASLVVEPVHNSSEQFVWNHESCPTQKQVPLQSEQVTPPLEDMDEECDDYISLGDPPSTETLFTLKINWDIFKELTKNPLKISSKGTHTRNSSSGSSNGSELGTTMKELFGPIKLYECTVPLASSETLSEISSMSSRASFAIKDSRSPLAKLKLGKNLSLRMHENGGKETNGFLNGNGNGNGYGKSHQRSLSCVYPEGKKLANNSGANHFGTLNGNSHRLHVEEDDDLGPRAINNNDNYSNDGFPVDEAQEVGTPYIPEQQEDDEETPTTRLPPYMDLEDAELLAQSIILDVEEKLMRKQELEESMEKNQQPGSSEIVQETNLDEEEEEEEEETQSPTCEGRDEAYNPVYPAFFSEPQEYGRTGQRSPFYTYSSQSPFGSNPSVQSYKEHDQG